MRIGLDGFPLAAPKTGVGHYTFELARALAILSPGDHFELISPSGFSEAIAAEVESLRNLSLVQVRTNMITRRWWGIGLPGYIRRAGLDLFHGTNYEVPLLNRKRTVVTVHDLSVFLHADKHETRIARRARRRLPVMLRSAGMVITATQAIKQEIVARFKTNANRIAVTPYAPRQIFQPMPPDDCARVRQRLGVDEDFILYVGTIEPRKNLSTLVRAFEQILRQTSLRPQLVIAGGKGWMMDEFHELIARADLGDRLHFTGYVDDEDLVALYSSCRVFVYPSVYEGFGLPPMEAMACGAPVIAGDIPVLRETFADSAVLVEPLDPHSLAKAIVSVLGDETEQARLSALSQRRAEQFSWSETARLTLEVYKQVLAKSSRQKTSSV
ncbi:MAG TPA: glycosyltransferase family 1 protein [Pyrinomonadaceae bacterium]